MGCVCVWVRVWERKRECRLWVCTCLCHEMHLKMRVESCSNSPQEPEAHRDGSGRTESSAVPQDYGRPKATDLSDICGSPRRPEAMGSWPCQRPNTPVRTEIRAPGLQAPNNRLVPSRAPHRSKPPQTTKGVGQKEYISNILDSLHWFPVKSWIKSSSHTGDLE